MKGIIGMLGMMLFGVSFYASADIKTEVEGKAAVQGYWTVISDETHKPSSVIQIIVKNDKLVGKVIKGLEKKKEGEADKYCTKCPLPFKDKRILGLEFLWGLEQNDPTHWGGGHVLDPESGRIYSVNASISEDGQKLMMRGYIGISLLGRTQTWLRRDHI